MSYGTSGLEHVSDVSVERQNASQEAKRAAGTQVQLCYNRNNKRSVGVFRVDEKIRLCFHTQTVAHLSHPGNVSV